MKDVLLEANVSTAIDFPFARDVEEGLSASPKTLPSKYFYNEVGDRIFQEIMEMDEYYLTRAEYNIFDRQKDSILSAISVDKKPFRLLELGAGDGLKTRVLLEYFVKQKVDFSYAPVDISGHVLNILEEKVSSHIPNLSITPLEGDYFDVLSSLSYDPKLRNVVLFLGSNIGNFSNEQAIEFMSQLRNYLNPGDMVLTGFDLKKNPDMILTAYHDPKGITRRFNLNLLRRINEELGGNIDVDSFQHYPTYNPSTGECRSYLLSTVDQKIFVEELGKEFLLKAWEPIFTEVSKKYAESEIDQLCRESGFLKVTNFHDENRYFVDSLWEVV